MIQRLDKLRELLKERMIPSCPASQGGRYVPDPKWAPMLALFVPGPGRQRDAFWNVIPAGALAGAIAEASVEVADLQEIIAAWTSWFMSDDGTDQAAVDYWIKRLKAGCD